jgi:hypothetical protein
MNPIVYAGSATNVAAKQDCGWRQPHSGGEHTVIANSTGRYGDLMKFRRNARKTSVPLQPSSNDSGQPQFGK